MSRRRQVILTDLDIIRIAECACEERALAIRRYCDSLGERAAGFWYCREDATINWFSKNEFARCVGKLGYKVKWETVFRRLRQLAQQGRYIRYLSDKGGIYKLLVRLEKIA